MTWVNENKQILIGIGIGSLLVLLILKPQLISWLFMSAFIVFAALLAGGLVLAGLIPCFAGVFGDEPSLNKQDKDKAKHPWLYNAGLVVLVAIPLTVAVFVGYVGFTSLDQGTGKSVPMDFDPHEDYEQTYPW